MAEALNCGAILVGLLLKLASLIVNFNATSTGTTTVSANTLVVTVYYSGATSSDALNITEFGFSVPSTSAPQGFVITIKGYASAATTLYAQMMKAGVPVGAKRQIALPVGAVQTFTLGSGVDLFGALWTYADLNNTQFGIQLTVEGSANAFVGYVTLTAYLISTSANFTFLATFTAQNGASTNLYLDADGNLYTSPTSAVPQQLSLVITGITPGSGAVGINGPGVEYLAFNNGVTGCDIPRQYTPEWIDRITQVGPGASPVFSPVIATTDTFGIATITQQPQQQVIGPALWSNGPGNTAAGNTVTFFYSNSLTNPLPDLTLTNAFNAGYAVYVYISGAPFGNGVALVTSIGNAKPPYDPYWHWYFTIQVPTSNFQNFPWPGTNSGYYQMSVATLTTTVAVPGLSVGNDVTISGASVTAYDNVWPISEALNSGEMGITETSVSSGVATYTYVVISGTPPVAGQLVTVTGTDNANGLLNVANATIATSTAYGGIVNTSGLNVSWVSGDNFSALTHGEAIKINGTSYVINVVSSSTALTITTSAGTQTGVQYFSGTLSGGTFTLGTSAPDTGTATEQGQATTAGTIFAFDPGLPLLGTLTNPIYGNSVGGSLTFTSASAQLVGAGTRQGTVFFITRNSYYTAPGPPVTFTCPSNTVAINAAQIPLGPQNVIARGIAFTEAGQNGVPGANFFTIPTPVEYIVSNVSYTTSALIINDNTTTSASLNFTDFVLLNSLAIDVYGYNLFNQIEIGNPAWLLNYASRNFYGGCQNKIQNFNNLSFDGGYLPSAQIVPLGWTQPDVYGSLPIAEIRQFLLHQKHDWRDACRSRGSSPQTAYQDAYQQPILNLTRLIRYE